MWAAARTDIKQATSISNIKAGLPPVDHIFSQAGRPLPPHPTPATGGPTKLAPLTSLCAPRARRARARRPRLRSVLRAPASPRLARHAHRARRAHRLRAAPTDCARPPRRPSHIPDLADPAHCCRPVDVVVLELPAGAPSAVVPNQTCRALVKQVVQTPDPASRLLGAMCGLHVQRVQVVVHGLPVPGFHVLLRLQVREPVHPLRLRGLRAVPFPLVVAGLAAPLDVPEPRVLQLGGAVAGQLRSSSAGLPNRSIRVPRWRQTRSCCSLVGPPSKSACPMSAPALRLQRGTPRTVSAGAAARRQWP